MSKVSIRHVENFDGIYPKKENRGVAGEILCITGSSGDTHAKVLHLPRDLKMEGGDRKGQGCYVQ